MSKTKTAGKVVEIHSDDTDLQQETQQKMEEAVDAATQINADYDSLLLTKPERHKEVVSESLREFVTLMQHVLGMNLADGQKASIQFKIDRKAKATEDGEIDNTVAIELTWDVPPVDKKTAWTLDSSKTVKRRSFRFRCDATGNHVLEDLPLFAELAFAETGEVKPEVVKG